MQEFLRSNKVSWNLMSLTGYRTLVILAELLRQPMSNEDINKVFKSNPYIGENFSEDTIRLYIHVLREIGCEITRANKTNNNKYILLSHPFDYDIPKTQLQALYKLHKNICTQISLEEAVALDSLISNIINKVNNPLTKALLQKLLMLKNINPELTKELMHHCNKKNQIIFTYNSPKSGQKNIEIIAEKLEFKNKKLYFFGKDITHGECSYFPISRIVKINEIKLKKDNIKIDTINVTYEIYQNNYKPEENEKILEQNSDSSIVQVKILNEFSGFQKFLQLGSSCKILSPETFKKKFVEKLKIMRKTYEKD